MTPAGACRSTSASRAARSATASASVRGLGPMNPARTCSATARSIGSPSTDSSAHSSSAVDSQRAVATAIGRSSSAASAACCRPATFRASAAHRAIRSGLSDQPPPTHSGAGARPGPPGRWRRPRPCRTGRAGRRPGSCRWPAAQPGPGPARVGPPAADQQAVDRGDIPGRRQPHPAGRQARRGLARPQHPAGPQLLIRPPDPAREAGAGATAHESSAVASPDSNAGEMTSATRSPRFTPACRSDVTRSALATDQPSHVGAGAGRILDTPVEIG